MQLYKDIRVAQAKTIVSSIIGVADRKNCKVMITRDNTLVIIVMDTAIYTTSLINVEFGDPIGFDYALSLNYQEDECIINIDIFNLVSNMYYLYQSIISNKVNQLAFEELVSPDDYEKLLKIKSKDGCQFFKLNGRNIGEIYYFPFFTGFPSINKSDKLGLEVFRFDNNYFVNVMNIYKKKINRPIKILYRVINLGGK